MSAPAFSSSNLVFPALELVPEGSGRSNPAFFYLARLSRGGSESGQRSALNCVCAWFLPGSTLSTFPWASLRFEHTITLRAYLAGRYSAATANRMISALRGALRAAWRLELMTLEQLERACDLPRVRGERLLCGRWVPAQDIAELLHAAQLQKPRRAARDIALLWLLFGAGLRRSEVCRLDRDDVVKEDGSLFVRVVGKNNKERRVPLPPQAVKPVLAFLRLRGPEAGPLFTSQMRCRPNGGTVGKWVVRLAETARIARTTSHDFRRAYISALLDRGADLSVVQQLAGHARPETTAKYDRRPEEVRVRASRLISVPEARCGVKKARPGNSGSSGSSRGRSAARRPGRRRGR